MCLITAQKKVRIAKKDMTVYKEFNIKGGVLSSPYRNFIYEKGQLYSTDLQESNDWRGFDCTDTHYLNSKYPRWNYEGDKRLICIGQGFHAALTASRLGEMGTEEDEIVLPVIIPKGSLYYTNKTGLIVSNQIIIP